MKQQFQIGWQIRFVRVTLNLKKIHQFLYICSNFDFVYQISRSNFLLDCVQQFYDIHAKFKQFQTRVYIYIYTYEWMCSNSKRKDSKIVTNRKSGLVSSCQAAARVWKEEFKPDEGVTRWNVGKDCRRVSGNEDEKKRRENGREFRKFTVELIVRASARLCKKKKSVKKWSMEEESSSRSFENISFLISKKFLFHCTHEL